MTSATLVLFSRRVFILYRTGLSTHVRFQVKSIHATRHVPRHTVCDPGSMNNSRLDENL